LKRGQAVETKKNRQVVKTQYQENEVMEWVDNGRLVVLAVKVGEFAKNASGLIVDQCLDCRSG